ncbi:MAG: prepilin-type N-terminal cleavage/methylation domain-containing protein [Pseudomonadales bacterium]|nr:prepilin-type N-terminal cleavage/methylation domain-containing protein [Pseudomonadales bacterium]
MSALRFQTMKGFTVIELVVTLVLISIVSVTAYSRWFDTSSFDATTLRSGVLSAARVAQRIALSHATAVVTLTVSRSGDQYTASVTETIGSVSQTAFSASIVTDTAVTASAGGSTQTLSSSVPLQLTFDSLGNVTAVVLGAVTTTGSQGVQLVTGSLPLCVSPVGYAHEGNCV